MALGFWYWQWWVATGIEAEVAHRGRLMHPVGNYQLCANMQYKLYKLQVY